MNKMYTIKHNLVALLTIIFTGVVGTYLVYQNSSSPTVPSFVKAAASEPEVKTDSQISSDGIYEIVMQTTINKDKTKTYIFNVTSKADNSTQTILTQTVPEGDSFSIPFNTFSPKDKYLFLIQTIQGKNHYLVFNSSGKVFTENQTSIDITPLFEKEKPDLVLKNVTGWASETVLICQTSGPSFWFELPGHFIQLSTRF